MPNVCFHELVTRGFSTRRYGDVEAVEDFIAVGKDVNARDSSQRTPLHYAIAFGKGDVGEEIFGMLMEAESDLTAVVSELYSCCIHAIDL